MLSRSPINSSWLHLLSSVIIANMFVLFFTDYFLGFGELTEMMEIEYVPAIFLDLVFIFNYV